jgi:multicomponent Na+:H+ antiporter subunit D
MITDAAAGSHLALVWFLLTAASAGVFLHAGIKFPWFVFFQKDSGLRPPDPPWTMRAGMAVCAILSIGIGIFPGLLYGLLPWKASFTPYTGVHVVSQLQLLLFSGLAFFAMLAWLRRTETITLDVDWFWRRGVPLVSRALGADAAASRGQARGLGHSLLRRIADVIRRQHGPAGPLAVPASTGAMAGWVVLMLAGLLCLHYF